MGEAVSTANSHVSVDGVAEFSWPKVLGALSDGVDLTAAEANWAMNEIMSDRATSAQIAAFGLAMRIKRPSPAELQALSQCMLSHALRVDGCSDGVDLVGTGGDRLGTVNISTMSSVIVAAADIKVVKHGNRAATSKSGGADMLEALGVAIALAPEQVAECVRTVGIGFCFAPVFHPAFRFVGPARREIGVPTVFNALGPLTNPAQPKAGLVGCAFAELMESIANVFAERGNSALVVRGNDGLDELTTTTTSTVHVVHNSTVEVVTLDPRDVGLSLARIEDLQGGDADYNADIARRVFAGETGPIRDAVLLNSAAAIAAYRGTSAATLVADLKRGMVEAADVIDSAAAQRLLQRWIQTSQRLVS